MRERMAAASSSMAKASAKAAASLKKGAAIAGEGAKLAAAAAAKQGAELVRKIEAAEPGKATVRRLVEGALYFHGLAGAHCVRGAAPLGI